MSGTVTIKRSELYRLVWQQPISRLARTYGLSDVGFAKMCRKYDIPRPPRGYWAKKQHGQAPAQTPLPEPGRDVSIELYDAGDDVTASPSPLGQEATERIADEKHREMRIEVGESLRGSHKLVSRANQELRSASTDENGLIIKPEGVALDILTSKASLRRVLLIMDALLKALERRGYEVEAGPAVKMFGFTLRFGISERLETRREEPEAPDLKGRYEFAHSRFRVRRVPSGRLTLAIHQADHPIGAGQHSWRDTGRRQLEERLNTFVAGLIEYAARLKAHAEKEARLAEQRRQEAERQAELRRREEARRQKEERRLAQKRERYEAERARVTELLDQAESYRQSLEVRELIEAVREAHAADGPIEPGSDLARWIEWAAQQADRLDPLRPSPPSILDEDLDDEDER